jgi:hypothetical protein
MDGLPRSDTNSTEIAALPGLKPLPEIVSGVSGLTEDAPRELICGGGVGAELIFTVADPDSAMFAPLVAITVTVFGLGTALGAVYSPLLEIVPAVEFPPCTPFTLQFTAEL